MNQHKRSQWFKCSKCPTKPIYKMKDIIVKNNDTSEIISIKQPVIPNWARHSEIIKNSIVLKGVKYTYGSNNISPFGYWEGSPYGYGEPIRNKFI